MATTLVALAATVATASVPATQSAAATASVAQTGTLESLVASTVPSVIASVLPSAVTTTVPVTATAIYLPTSFEVAAIFAGALSGGLVAVNRRFDITGILALALVNGLGGGMIRDLLLQSHGVFALEESSALIAVLAASAVAMFFASLAERLRSTLLIVDAFSLGLFCLVGTDKSLVAGLGAVPAILLGSITAVGGGMLRDILCDREPEILRRGGLYSLAAIAGSGVYVVLVTWLNFAKYPAMALAAIIAVSLRLGALWLGWESPEPLDLSGQVVELPRRLLRGTRQLFGRRGRR